jgi:hypothetical protein
LAEYQRRGRSGEIAQMNALLAKGEASTAQLCPVAAPDLCGLITRYLRMPPGAFVADRGELMRSGYWHATTTMPSASCYLRQQDRTTKTAYRFSCVINSKNGDAVVQKYYTDSVKDIDACVGRMGTASRWNRTPVNLYSQDDDETTTGQDWSLTDGSASYDIEVDKITSPTESYNSLAIEFDSAKN